MGHINHLQCVIQSNSRINFAGWNSWCFYWSKGYIWDVYLPNQDLSEKIDKDKMICQLFQLFTLHQTTLPAINQQIAKTHASFIEK